MGSGIVDNWHDVEMQAIEPRDGYERFRYHCLGCPWELIVTEDDTPDGTPPDAHVQAIAHRRTGKL
jgi:hypothetical protein